MFEIYKKKQGIVKVLISYQIRNLQCSFFKFATCGPFLINTKILSFWMKLENYASYKKSHESKHSFSSFYISLSKIKALGSIIKKKLVPLIDNTNELIRKILSEQLHNHNNYAS